MVTLKEKYKGRRNINQISYNDSILFCDAGKKKARK